LHDIGKALDHEKEGGHPEIGGEIISKFNEAPEIIEGIVGHHNDIQLETMYATLINTADAISASRPGARRETFEKYINRLEKLESIAYNVPGIENAFAISAGREIRVIVNPEEISDKETSVVAQKIAKEIEKELHYPGKIKITVVREMKIVEYAH
jgi:ribonuclease Y